MAPFLRVGGTPNGTLNLGLDSEAARYTIRRSNSEPQVTPWTVASLKEEVASFGSPVPQSRLSPSQASAERKLFSSIKAVMIHKKELSESLREANLLKKRCIKKQARKSEVDHSTRDSVSILHSPNSEEPLRLPSKRSDCKRSRPESVSTSEF